MTAMRREQALIPAAKFNAVAALEPLLKPAQREAARLVLVEGCSQAEAGRRVGFTRQNVHVQVRRVQVLARTFELAKAAEQDCPTPGATLP